MIYTFVYAEIKGKANQFITHRIYIFSSPASCGNNLKFWV